MHTIVLEGIITALTSISHIGETLGTQAMLRREKILLPDGTVEEIPIISGNSLRGILRDRGMLHMLQVLGYGVNKETGEVQGISLPAFHFLFSGGVLESSLRRGIDLDEAERWRRLIPLVSLFGGAVGNQILPGKLLVGKAIPICQETAHILPPRYFTGNVPSIWDLLQEEAYTRRDDGKNTALRALIAPEGLKMLEAEDRKRQQRLNGEDVVEQPGTHQQMRYRTETIAAGTRLFWNITLNDPTPLEWDAFCVTLAEFARSPHIGGRSAIGHGKVEIQFDNWMIIDPRMAPTGQELAPSLGTLYLEHLAQRGPEIREIIDGFGKF